MKLSPLDIRKQEFNRVMRGYDVDEVRAFLSTVATQMDDLIEEQERAQQDLDEHRGKMGHLEDVQEALQATLNMARQNAEEARKAAMDKAELIVHEAHLKAEEILKKAEAEIDRLRAEITHLESNRDRFVAKLRSVLNAELEMLTSIKPEPADKQRDGAVETAGLAFIDPDARKRREEILAKAAVAKKAKSVASQEKPAEDENEVDMAAGGDSLPDMPEGDESQDVRDISEVVAALKAEVDEAADQEEGEVADTEVTGPSAAEYENGEQDKADQEEIQKIRRILDDLE